MTTINLRDFFYWYKVDEFIKVTDEVAQELRAGKVEDVTHWRRLKRNKANYSLDAGDGIEYEPPAPGTRAADRCLLPAGAIHDGNCPGRGTG